MFFVSPTMCDFVTLPGKSCFLLISYLNRCIARSAKIECATLCGAHLNRSDNEIVGDGPSGRCATSRIGVAHRTLD